jgi:hypothetical protein
MVNFIEPIKSEMSIPQTLVFVVMVQSLLGLNENLDFILKSKDVAQRIGGGKNKIPIANSFYRGVKTLMVFECFLLLL